MEKKRKMRLPARATLFYGVGIVLSRAIGVLTTPIFTRAMSESEYGLYSYYISILSITSMISGVFLTPAVFYSGLGKFSDNKSGFVNKAIFLTSGINLCFCTLLFTFNSFLGINKEFAVIILFQGILDAVINSELLKSKFSYGYGKVLLINLSTSFLSAIISIILVCTLGMGAMGRILGLLLGGALVSIPLILTRKDRGSGGCGAGKFLIKNALPLIPAVIARASIGWADKLIIKGKMGVDSLAKYSVAHTVGTALFALIGALCSALNPWLVRKLTAKKREEIFPIIREISALASWGGVAIVATAPEIFAFLAPSGYRDAIYVIAPLALSSAIYFLYTVASVIISFDERTKIISLSSAFGAVVSLVINFALIPTLGYLGGGLAYFIGEVAMYSSAIFFMGKWDKEAARALSPTPELYISILIGVVFTLLYPHSSVRIFLLIIPLCELARHTFSCLQIAREK